MGIIGLLAFLWSMRNGQYEDLDGAAERVLLDDAAETPLNGRTGGVATMTDPITETTDTRGPMEHSAASRGDRPFDWVAALALAAGVAVILPGMLALFITLFAVLFKLT
jgi:cbb3-type cytochrome oxidase maturation protein